jgi:hypothetical protein
MTIQRRTFLTTGLAGLAWTAMHGVAAASITPTSFVIHVSGAVGGPRARFVISVSGPSTAHSQGLGKADGRVPEARLSDHLRVGH